MIFIVIPCLNERRNLPGLFAALRPVARGLGAHVIFIDDGSSDGSGKLARELARDVPLSLVTHERNLGLGAAVASGLRAAMHDGDDDDVIITVESDNTAELSDIERLVDAVREGADVVMASYLSPGGHVVGVSRWRVAASYAATALFRVVGGLREFHQVTPLYRAYRVAAVRRAAELYGEPLITETGFAVNVELLMKVRASGARVAEIPTTLDWSRRQGESTMPIRATAVAYARLILASRAQQPGPRPEPVLAPEPSVSAEP